MACYQEITCPDCGGNQIMKAGRSALGVQRYRCQNPACTTKTSMLTYRYKARESGTKEQAVDMAMAINGSGIRDTARALKTNKNTAISTLKKAGSLSQINPNFCASPSVNREVAGEGMRRGGTGRTRAVCRQKIQPTLALVRR